METIILKIILCSGIVLGLYYLFLAKEKIFTFNRFYLLLGLIFSYVIPFVTIEKQILKEKASMVLEQEIPQQVLQNPVAIQADTFDYTQLFLIIYFVISSILIVKILHSIIKIKTLKGRKIIYQNRKVVLLEKEMAPFSFLNIIYLSENYFKDGKIDERIFLHEEIHVKQKHSFDILFIEVLKAFSWFNPFIYFYKNAMITNHEFLADEEVIIKNDNIKNYQELILNEVLKQQNLPLTHQFNFNNTKKRFIMMTKRNSKFAKAKKYLAIPVFIALTMLFAERVYANDHKNADNNLSLIQPLKVNKSHSTDAIKDFLEITDKYPATSEEDKTNVKKDTITSNKNMDIKVSEVKSASTYLNDDDTVQDLAIAPAISITQEVSTLPEYPGGINAMRNKVSQNFNGAVLKGGEGLIRSNINFTIDEKGEVSNIKSSGNNEIFNIEAIKSVKLATENVTWKPATKDGKPVKYIFKLPLTMTFETFKKTQ